MHSVKSILDFADINVIDGDGMKPILIAARYGMRRVFELLINKGADMSAEGNYSSTILHNAIDGGDWRILKLTLRVDKLDVNRNNDLGAIPLKWTRILHRNKMMALLKRSRGHF